MERRVEATEMGRGVSAMTVKERRRSTPMTMTVSEHTASLPVSYVVKLLEFLSLLDKSAEFKL